MPSFPNTASEWIVRLNGRALSPDEEQALATWLAVDERHHEELFEAQMIWRLAGQLWTNPAARAHLLRDSVPPTV